MSALLAIPGLMQSGPDERMAMASMTVPLVPSVSLRDDDGRSGGAGGGAGAGAAAGAHDDDDADDAIVTGEVPAEAEDTGSQQQQQQQSTHSSRHGHQHRRRREQRKREARHGKGRKGITGVVHGALVPTMIVPCVSNTFVTLCVFFVTTVVLDGGEPRTPQTSPGGMQSATPATTPVGVDDLSEALSAALGAGDARRRRPGGSDEADNGPYDASMQDAMRSMAPQAMVASMEGRALPRTTSERTGTFVRCP